MDLQLLQFQSRNWQSIFFYLFIVKDDLFYLLINCWVSSELTIKLKLIQSLNLSLNYGLADVFLNENMILFTWCLVKGMMWMIVASCRSLIKPQAEDETWRSLCKPSRTPTPSPYMSYVCNQLLLVLELHSVSTELPFASLSTVTEFGSVINKGLCVVGAQWKVYRNCFYQCLFWCWAKLQRKYFTHKTIWYQN